MIRIIRCALAALGAMAGLSVATAQAEQDCSPLPGWEEVAEAATGKYLVFGETHGSEQSPAAVENYVCALSGTGGAILLAIEFGSRTDEVFQQAWAASPDDFRTVLLDGVGEWSVRKDGVASQAMMAMLERLHALADAGRDIDIVAFNGARDAAQRDRFAHLPGQGPHEAAQAENIRLAAEAREYDHVVVLVGNLHARKNGVAFGAIAFEPMAMKLAGAGDVISLKQLHDGGTTWSCRPRPGYELVPGVPIPQEDIECGAHAVGGEHSVGGDPRMGFWQGDAVLDEDYDGFYYVGPVSASPPVNAQ